jgi:hypothetical protein
MHGSVHVAKTNKDISADLAILDDLGNDWAWKSLIMGPHSWALERAQVASKILRARLIATVIELSVSLHAFLNKFILKKHHFTDLLGIPIHVK